jgi:hypothetical protein
MIENDIIQYTKGIIEFDIQMAIKHWQRQNPDLEIHAIRIDGKFNYATKKLEYGIYADVRESANTLNFGVGKDEYLFLLCEGCGRNVRVDNEGNILECNTCKFGNEGTCNNCQGVEGHITEIVGKGICGNFSRR